MHWPSACCRVAAVQSLVSRSRVTGRRDRNSSNRSACFPIWPMSVMQSPSSSIPPRPHTFACPMPICAPPVLTKARYACPSDWKIPKISWKIWHAGYEVPKNRSHKRHLEMEFLVRDKTCFAFTGGKPYEAGRPTVVFIHGAQHDHSVWILQSRYLAHHGFSVLALDLPGHGKSVGPALTRIEAMADWVLDVLSALGASEVTLIGHSMGS